MKIALIGLLSMFALASAVRADEGTSTEGTSIREESPETGTRIRKDAATWKISFKKRYEELSDEERQSLRASYENMPQEDEPPYPADGMENIVKDIVQIQQAVLAKGKMFAVVDVDDEGNGRSVKFYEIPDPDMARPVALVLMKVKYKPAKCSGQPCAMEFPLPLNFRIRK